MGQGSCAREGSWICAPDGQGLSCDAPATDDNVEVCDDADNDCDGLTDEGFQAGDPCDDKDPCTAGDVYDDACGCFGTPYTCVEGPCHRTSECDGRGGCEVTIKPVGSPCDDGLDETENDTCRADGSCVGDTVWAPDTATDTITDTRGDADTATETNGESDTNTETEVDTGEGDTEGDIETDEETSTDGKETDESVTLDGGTFNGIALTDSCDCSLAGQDRNRFFYLFKLLARLF
jgi:hypothetical protein